MNPRDWAYRTLQTRRTTNQLVDFTPTNERWIGGDLWPMPGQIAHDRQYIAQRVACSRTDIKCLPSHIRAEQARIHINDIPHIREITNDIQITEL